MSNIQLPQIYNPATSTEDLTLENLGTTVDTSNEDIEITTTTTTSNELYEEFLGYRQTLKGLQAQNHIGHFNVDQLSLKELRLCIATLEAAGVI